jgi:signal transduction histidine kinase
VKPTLLEGKPRRVKAAFIGTFAIVLAFIMGIFLVAIYSLEFRIRESDLAERSSAVAKLFDQKLNKDASLMRAVQRAMMANEVMEKAFEAGDRNALAREAGPLFSTLRAEHRITHLYFTGPELKNLLRLHSPDMYGDQIKRVTMLNAKYREDTVHGLELGSLGTLTLRLVAPWRRGDRIIGYIELGEEVGHLVDEIRHSLSVDLIVLVDKRFLRQDQWERGLDMMNREGQWDRFTGYAAVAQTTAQVLPALNDQHLASLHTGGTLELEDRGSLLHVASLPIDDAGGNRIGEVIVIRDITALDKTFRWSIAAVTLLCLLAGGGVLGLFNTFLDRVERDYRRHHDLERQLLRMSSEHQRILQLEKLSALGTMVGGIAHQLNNPLVGVVNMAQLAEREVDDPARVRELLAEIRHAGQDCNAFIRRMLEFSKVSSFESKLTPMGPLIEETVLLFRQTGNRSIPVEVRLPPQPVVMAIDPILIRHALFNLLANAAQATVGDGAIVIDLEPAADPDSGAPGWALSVTDHGQGIAMEDLDKIFIPFFTTRSDGTGLGLPVVQHVAFLHQGTVTASCQPDGGTRFAFWLPDLAPGYEKHAA